MLVEGMGKPEGCKLIRIRAELEGGVIKAIRIRGDFFASPEEQFEEVESRLVGLRLETLADSFDLLVQEAGVEVSGISGTGAAAVLCSAKEKV